MSRKNPTPAPVVQDGLDRMMAGLGLERVAAVTLGASKTVKIAFARLFTNDDGTFCAEGDDGATWTLSPNGDAWDVRNDLAKGESARAMDVKAWTKAGLPLSLELDLPEPEPADEPAIAERNPIESAAPADTAPVATAEPEAESTSEGDVLSLPPLPEGNGVPKETGFRRKGSLVPFVVVPCALVAPAIRIRKRGGGSAVQYRREEISTVETPLPGSSDKTEKNVTKTTRIIDAIEEFRAVDSDRGRLRAKILDTCSNTCIGWLCPRRLEGELRKRVADVQAQIRTINDGTTHYTLTDGCVIAIIETDADVAAKTVRDTLKDALEGLREAFQQGDYEGMRAIVRGLKGFDALVNDEAAQKVGEAIAEARRIANTISREVVRKARKLEDVQAELSLEAIDTARFMLMAQEGEVQEEGEPLPEVDGRNLEVESEDDSATEAPGETAVSEGDDAGAVA